MASKGREETPEIDAYRTVYLALKGLDATAQLRVLRYSAEMLGLDLGSRSANEPTLDRHEESASGSPTTDTAISTLHDVGDSDGEDGINAVALKWMRRNNLNAKSLQKLFSLGMEEIDLVADSVPGQHKKERMRSVLLLKGIAAYLSTGVARVAYEQLKEACLHYDAYDSTNFSKHLKSFAAEVGGTKGAGLTLTARGLTSATDLVKEILEPKSKS